MIVGSSDGNKIIAKRSDSYGKLITLTPALDDRIWIKKYQNIKKNYLHIFFYYVGFFFKHNNLTSYFTHTPGDCEYPDYK